MKGGSLRGPVFLLYVYCMPRNKNGLFVWDEAQCFVGVDGGVATSYTNDQITITFMQDENGVLTDFCYETDETCGEVVVNVKKEND